MSRIKDKKIDVREIVYSEDDEKSFGDVFIYEPENIEEQNLGNLFIVGELKDQPRNSSYIMNVLASKIKKEFYSNTKRSAEEGLEAGLSEANKTISDLAEQGNGEYVGKLSMVCGTYRNNRFYLSQIGRIKSLLIRKGQLLEIVKDDGGKPISPKRAFNNIASGELADGDLVIFSSEGLFNVVSLERLRQLGSSMKLDDLAVKLQEEIEEEDGSVVSALMIEIEGGKKELIEHSDLVLEEKKDLAGESLAKALEEENALDEAVIEAEVSGADTIEEETAAAAVLAEESSLSSAMESAIDEAASHAKKADEAVPVDEERDSRKMDAKAAASKKSSEEKSDASSNGESFPSDDLVASSPVIPLATVPAAKDSGKISLSDIIREYERMESRSQENVSDKDKSIEDLVTKKEANNFEDLDEGGEKLHEKVISRARESILSVGAGLSNASLAGAFKKAIAVKKEYNVQDGGRKLNPLGNRKVLVVLAFVVIIVSAYAYSSRKEKDEAAARVATYRALMDESRSKMDQAEVEMISGSEDNAGKLYAEAMALAKRVESEYDALDSEAGGIIANAQSELDKIDKVVRVGDASIVATFDNPNVNNLDEVGGDIYAIDGQDNAVYRIDAQDSKLVQTAKASENIGKIIFSGSFQNQEILLSDGSAFASFSIKSGQVQKMTARMDSEIKDFATYGRYVYVLSPAENQIYKYQKSGTSLDGKTAWIKSGDVTDAVSMAIDQYVYILTSGGQIKRYYTGEESKGADGSSFAIKQPNDAITAATKIFTSTDQKNLYVMEPSKNRVMLFDRSSGDLVKQFAGDGLNQMKDIFVDSEEKELYVLMEDKIVEIDLAL